MVRSKESATVHSSKELHCRSFICKSWGKKKKKKKKRLEHWVGNWEQLDWSPLGGWIPSAHIVPLEDESARGDRSKKLKILRMRKEAT